MKLTKLYLVVCKQTVKTKILLSEIFKAPQLKILKAKYLAFQMSPEGTNLLILSCVKMLSQCIWKNRVTVTEVWSLVHNFRKGLCSAFWLPSSSYPPVVDTTLREALRESTAERKFLSGRRNYHDQTYVTICVRNIHLMIFSLFLCRDRKETF